MQINETVIKVFDGLVVDVSTYIQDKSKYVENLLSKSFDGGYIDEVTFRRLSGDVGDAFKAKTLDEAFTFFHKLLTEMIEIGQNNRLEKIVRGGEYIESITPDHPNWEKANARYDSLVSEYRSLRRRIDGILPFEPTEEELEAEQ